MKFLTLGLGLAMCVAIALLDAGIFRHTLAFIHKIPYGDKWVHFSMLGMMAFAINISFPSARVPLRMIPFLRGSALLAALATLDECSHALLSTREFSVGDLLANYAGIICFGRLAAYWANRVRRQPPLVPIKLAPRDIYR